jgi:hypothetical protein
MPDHDCFRRRLLTGCLLLALVAPACSGRRFEQRAQRIRVETTPPGATVWLQTEAGHQPLGTSPLDVEQSYEVEFFEFNPWLWLVAGLSVGVTAGGGVWYAYTPESDGVSQGLSIAMMVVGGLVSLVALPGSILGQLTDGNEVRNLEREITLGAHLAGHQPASLQVRVPGGQPRLHLLLPEQATTPDATATSSSRLLGRAPLQPPVVAVFDLKVPQGLLTQADAEQLVAHLSTRLAELGKARVVPREQIRARLLAEKAGTFRACFDEACQLELGKALAAEKVVSTTLLRVGKRCAVAVNMYDLRSEAAERGASVETGCGLEELLGAIGQAAQKL